MNMQTLYEALRREALAMSEEIIAKVFANFCVGK